MTLEKKQHIYDLVKIICGSTVSFKDFERHDDGMDDVPTDDTWSAAKELLLEAGVSPYADIFEIPLCWNDQVCIRFSLGEWKENETVILFDLSAGVSNTSPNKFFFCLQIEPHKDIKCPSDDDIGIFLIHDYWGIKDGKITSV